MAQARAKEYVQQEETQKKAMEVNSARSVRELTTMFEDIEFHKKNMMEKHKLIRNKGLIGRSVPEEPEKSSLRVVDAQANNDGTKVVCDTVHTAEIFVKSFISLLLLHIMFSILIILYSPTSPFGSFPTTLLLAISHVQLGLVVLCVEVMCCVTTQIHAHMMPS